MSEKTNSKEKKSSPKHSDAGKGSKSRVRISPKEWGERYEKIFRKKKKSIRSHKTDNSGSKS